MKYRLIVRHHEGDEEFIDVFDPLFVPAPGDTFAPMVRTDENTAEPKGLFRVVSRMVQYEQAGEWEVGGSEDVCKIIVKVEPF